MKTCERCGSEVTEPYFRVNSVKDEFGSYRLWSCPACSPDGTTLRGPGDKTGSRAYDDEDYGED